MRSMGLLDAPVNSPLLQWDPRWRLISLLVLAFAISFVDRIELVPWIVAITVFFLVWSRVPPLQILGRLRYPSLVVFALVALLPFLAEGRVVAEWAGLTATREGIDAALVITARFFSILSLAILFLGVAPLLVHIRAARSLGVPDLIADLALLVVRHIEILSADLRQMRIAMRLRGDAGNSWRSLRSLVWLVGSLLLRSHERSARVYQAMRLRGYGVQTGPPVPHTGPRAYDHHMTFLVLLSATIIVALQVWWPA